MLPKPSGILRSEFNTPGGYLPTNATQTMPNETLTSEFSHINIMEIDPTFKPVEEGFYTLQVNSLKSQTVKPQSGKNAGKEVLVLKGSYTIVGDDRYSGRKFWKTFWTTSTYDLKDLRRQADATGVTQEAGQPLEEYAAVFETLVPPAEMKIFVGVEKDFRNPDQDVNVLKFTQAQPTN